MGISIFMIALNEESKIAKALDSVRWADEVIVVDGGSQDRTAQICRQHGARVFERPFDDFASQKNYAIAQASHNWVFGLDADESVSDMLAQAVQRVTQTETSAAGFKVERRNLFLGKHLRFGGQGKEWILRLFRKEAGSYHGIVHEEIQLGGRSERLNGVLNHQSTASIDEYMKKLPIYTGFEARRMAEEHRVPNFFKATVFPFLIWVRDYIVRGGFLDGRAGCLYHALSCYYRWIKNFRARSTQPTSQVVSV
jgi:glycosyltransferase involved in cell wall biosynthesis